MLRAESRGLALLEVLVALVILSSAGCALLGIVTHGLQAAVRARAVDAHWRGASAYLDVIWLWPREDLDRHLGTRREGRWRVTVLHPSPPLYRVSVRDTAYAAVALSTVVYRPERDDVAR